MTFKIQDHYFKKAKKENFLARSIYKLEEIDQKFKVIQNGDRVLDLGYSPGSWMQYISKKIGEKGFATGIDIKEVNKTLIAIKNVSLFKKDIFSIESLSEIDANEPFDVVCSDMAPNTTGIKSVDQDRSLNLVEKVFSMLPIFLKEDGYLVIKVFDSHSAQVFLKEQKALFQKMQYLKPKSTRSVSKEFFVIGMGYKA